MNLTPALRQRYFDSNGLPLAGGKLYTYQAGTTTLQATYTDATGATPNTNPIILSASGDASVWLDPNLSYKFILQDANGVQQWVTDGVVGLLGNNAVQTASIQDGAVTTTKLADGAATVNKLAAAAVSAAKLASDVLALVVPTGSVLAFAGTSAPNGFLLCDGSAVSRATYGNLFSVIGTAHGSGDGTATFNIPDYRGRFLRGSDGGTNRDPNAASRAAMNAGGNTTGVGSIQGGATARPGTAFTASSSQGAHAHDITVTKDTPAAGGGGRVQEGTSSSVETLNGTNNVGMSSGAHGHTIDGGGDSETRPINAAVNYIIKT